MKQRKKNERNEGQRPADLGLSLSGYTAFSGDPRLSRPLSAITENTKAPAGKKRSRLISTVTAVLITATVVALPLIFLWNYLGEGQDTPTPPTYDEPPVYTPPQSEHTQTPTPTTTPTTPTTPTSSYWVPAEFTLDIDRFYEQYLRDYGKMSLGFGLYGTGNQKELTASVWITQCTPIIKACFHYKSYSVEWEGSHTTQILTFFLLDELETLRQATPTDGVAGEKDCLLVIERAAARFAKVCYQRLLTYTFSDPVVLAKVREEDVSTILGGYTIGQWRKHASVRDGIYDVVWSKYMSRSSVRALYDGYAEQISQGLMLYLYGYTYEAYMKDGENYYDILNAGMDWEEMRQKQLALIDYIAERLPRFPEVEKEVDLDRRFSVGVIPYVLYQSVIDMMPDIVTDVLGMKYEEFLSSGAFVRAPYDGGLLRARCNENSENAVLGIPRLVDRDRLNDFLATLSFEEGEISFTKVADISFYSQILSQDMLDMLYLPLPVLTVGKDKNGICFLQSGRYYTPLTRKQYAEFISICTEGEIDNGPYGYERQALLESLK